MEWYYKQVWNFYQFLGSLCLLFPEDWELPIIVWLMDWCVEKFPR